MARESMTRLLLIGAAGLDWPGVNARIEAGEAPNLAALRARGAAGWLRGWPPFEGPAPWTTLVTGRYPEAHGVWRTQEAWAAGARPVSRASWRAAPLWARLAEAGVSTGSVGWPAARPGAAWAGDHVDRDFAVATGRSHDDWALPLDCAPPDAREALRDLRVHPSEITGDMLAPLVPGLSQLDQSRDTALPHLAVAMAQAASIQAAAAWLLTERRPAAVFVHHEWLAVAAGAFERHTQGPFARVVDGAWRFFDGLVGRLAELAGPDALVVVASPGWRQNPGVAIAAGPGVAPDGFQGAEAVDLAPSLLAAFGLEDRTLPGQAIPALAPEGPRRPAPEVAIPPAPPADFDLLREAIAAGHPAPPPLTPDWWAGGFSELAFTTLQRDARTALAAADAALERKPDHAPALDAKAVAHVLLDEPDPLPDLAAALRKAAPQQGWGDLAEAAWLVMQERSTEAGPHIRAAERDRDPDFLARVAAVWFAAGQPAEAARVFQDLLALDAGSVTARVGLGAAAAARRDFRAAEQHLVAAVRLDPGRRPAWAQLADVYRKTGRVAEGDRAARLAESGPPPVPAR